MKYLWKIASTWIYIPTWINPQFHPKHFITSKERNNQMPPRSKIPVNVRNTQLLRSMAKRRGIRLRTTSHVQQSRSEILANPSDSQGGRMSRVRDGRHSEPVNPKDPGIPPPEDVMKPSIDLRWHPRIQRWYWRIRGKFRTFFKANFPPPTPEQIEAREDEEAEKEKDKICLREGHIYGTVAAKKLAQLNGIDPYHLEHVQLVRWQEYLRDEYGSKIILVMDTDPRRLPPYLLLSRLTKDPAYTEDLSAAIGLPVEWEVGVEGVTLTIYRQVEKPRRKSIKMEDLLENDEKTYT